MTPETGLLCEKCHAPSVHLSVGEGRIFSYRNLVPLPIPDDFAVPTCNRCVHQYFDEATRAKLMLLLAPLYRQTLQLRIRQALEKLDDHISQRRLEGLLGLSQGYLSRLRSGSGIPSPELVSHLALLASDPDVRLRELERFWGWPSIGRSSGGPAAATSSAMPADRSEGQPADGIDRSL